MPASVEEVENLADNWCHDHLSFEHYGHRTQLYQLCVEAYAAGYEQAATDIQDDLR